MENPIILAPFRWIRSVVVVPPSSVVMICFSRKYCSQQIVVNATI